MDYHPISLISMLQRYSREDYGTVFLYLPRPRRSVDADAWRWIRAWSSEGITRRRWLISADEAKGVLGSTHPHLFDPPPICFEAYMLNAASLDRIFARL